MRFIDKKEIYSLADYRELVEIAKKSLMDLSKEKIDVPQRIHINNDDSSATYLFMPSLSKKLGRVACKYVGVCNDNAKIGLASINGIFMLADSKTGVVESILDAASLTAVRTAAISAASVDVLADDNAKIVSIFGSSTQAESQIRAVCSIRNIEKVYLFYRTKEKAEKLKNRLSNLGVDIELSDDRSCLEISDIIITATNTIKPLFGSNKQERFKDGVHISAIGSFKPNMQEVGECVYRDFVIFVDHKESCIKESGDIILPLSKNLIKEDCINEIGNLLSNNLHSYKHAKTIFKSVGNAAFDLYVADYILKKSTYL